MARRGPGLGAELLLGGGEARFLLPLWSPVGSAFSGPTRSPGSCISPRPGWGKFRMRCPRPCSPAPRTLSAWGAELQGPGACLYSLVFSRSGCFAPQHGLAHLLPLKIKFLAPRNLYCYEIPGEGVLRERDFRFPLFVYCRNRG